MVFSVPSQDVLLPRPDEEAHEEEGAGILVGAQQAGDSCWRGENLFVNIFDKYF